jgi:ABC-type uncharacterized transport system substrate-binding protein
MLNMRRREFMTLLGGAAAWPLAARAQQPRMPVVGYLYTGTPDANPHFVAAFRQGLKEMGYVEGTNVAIEYRWAAGRYDRLPELATDLVQRQVAVIAVPGNLASALAAKAATATIPIVFAIGGDSVKAGLVASVNRPGGNLTGVNFYHSELGAKRLELLREISRPTLVGVLFNPSNPEAEDELKDVEAAARALRQQIVVLKASSSSDIDLAFATLVEQRADALMTTADTLFNNRRVQIVSLAARHAIPAIYVTRDWAAAGGLISYGAYTGDAWRTVGIYAGRILKGERTAELPVVQPTKFDFVINLQTAKLLGLTVPPTLLARADEVIE